MATESWVVSGPQIIEVEQISSLRVQVVGGRVDVVAHEDPAQQGARIEVHSVEGRPLEVGLRGGELTVGYSFTLGGWESFVDKFRSFQGRERVEVHIAVPQGSAVRLGTVSAEGLLAGLEEDASVSTVSGQLVTDSTRGALTVNTVSGDVVVRAHDGDLGLNTVSGDLTCSGRLSRVNANLVSGSLALDVTSTASSVATTSVSGDVTLRLPVGSGVKVEARSVSGRVLVDGQDHRGGRIGTTAVERPGDGPTSFVTTTSVTGDLTVIREQAV